MNHGRAMLATVLLATVSAVSAEVVWVDVERRDDVADGRSYGSAGAYERLAGRIHYAVDPANPVNRIVTDIDYAPTGSDGRVGFSADFVLVKPKDVSAGNGAVFFEVANRGRIGVLGRFNGAASTHDPLTGADYGDGFLLEEGFTLLWVGWQHDTPLDEGLLRVYPPVATDSGVPIEGLVRSDVFVNEMVYSHSLGDRGHVAYPVANPSDQRNVLTVRDGMNGERRTIPREQWRFARVEGDQVADDPTSVHLGSGFEPGRIYDVVYVAENPPLAGFGLVAIRDAISILKYGSGEARGNSGGGVSTEASDIPGGVTVEGLDIPEGVLDRAIAFGSSQSGRLLRTWLYDGFNGDEHGRRVFDGVIAHIAGAARGSFNVRFAQPSRAPGGAFEYPNRLFPFADAVQTDPITGSTDGLLANMGPDTMPLVFYTNSSTEYWRSVGALAHTTPDGKQDLPLPDNSRIYHFAGTQHGPAPFPPPLGHDGHLRNPNDYDWFLRSLLLRMDLWITDSVPAPPSRYATLEEGTLVSYEQLGFPKVPGVEVLEEVSILRALDFGPDLASRGVITREPPGLGPAYPFLVPGVDESGNEIGGLRSPDIAVPLGTYTGWLPGNPVSGAGVYAPFARTRAEREAMGDPRPSIEERYEGRAQYLTLVEEAAQALVEEGYMRGEDLAEILEAAGGRWDFHMRGAD